MSVTSLQLSFFVGGISYVRVFVSARAAWGPLGAAGQPYLLSAENPVSAASGGLGGRCRPRAAGRRCPHRAPHSELAGEPLPQPAPGPLVLGGPLSLWLVLPLSPPPGCFGSWGLGAGESWRGSKLGAPRTRPRCVGALAGSAPLSAACPRLLWACVCPVSLSHWLGDTAAGGSLGGRGPVPSPGAPALPRLLLARPQGISLKLFRPPACEKATGWQGPQYAE